MLRSILRWQRSRHCTPVPTAPEFVFELNGSSEIVMLGRQACFIVLAVLYSS
jgi:hypothetical protein